MKHNYEYSNLKTLVEKSTSMKQILEQMDIVPAGGNYATLRSYIKKYKLDTSHFTGQAWSKGIKVGLKKPIESYLVPNSKIQSYKLKRKLLKAKMFEYKCHNCNNNSWLNKPIPLELHHKDGDNSNNILSNLTLLCPNCHALTDNYRGKNK